MNKSSLDLFNLIREADNSSVFYEIREELQISFYLKGVKSSRDEKEESLGVSNFLNLIVLFWLKMSYKIISKSLSFKKSIDSSKLFTTDLNNSSFELNSVCKNLKKPILSWW